mmetsp:Transcript_109239/g.296210  ORF Transcript_109239/g.296210 Transcript_109239/m.296210 type:complete len:95 (-) Transcript_109239:642-926(-)
MSRTPSERHLPDDELSALLRRDLCACSRALCAPPSQAPSAAAPSPAVPAALLLAASQSGTSAGDGSEVVALRAGAAVASGRPWCRNISVNLMRK